jgi:hypothetical protein
LLHTKDGDGFMPTVGDNDEPTRLMDACDEMTFTEVS